MAKTTSAHTNPKITPQLEHNDRTDNRSKNIYKEKTHLNECNKTAQEVKQEIDKLYAEAMQKQKGIKGKKTPKENSFKEFIYEIDENTTMEQCEKLSEKIAELTGFRPLQIAIHRDEGHYNEQGDFVTHYHAHAVFFTLDKETGKQLARLQASLNPKNLSKIQDLAAETFQMQRGERRYENGEKKAYPKDYREYKKIKEREREILNKAQETQKNAIELQKNIEAIQIELKNKKNDLNAKESVLNSKEQEIQKIESGYPEAFNEINLKQRQEKKGFFNFVKNILTGGKHFKRIEQKYTIAKNAITAQKMKNEKMLRLEREKLEKEKKRAKEVQEMQEQEIQKIEMEIKNLDQENLKYFNTIQQQASFIKEAEKEILKNIDWTKEMEYLRRNSTLRPELSEMQKEIINREMQRRTKLEQQNTKQYSKDFTLSI